MIKFVIVTEIRTGYKYLASCLRSHPHAFCFGEIFGSERWNRIDSLVFPLPPIEDGQDSIKYLDDTIFAFAEKNHWKAAGFKLNYVCARQPAWAPLWDQIKEEDWKVVHLTRKNLFDRVLSELLAVNEQNWSDDAYNSKMPIDIKHVHNMIQRSMQWQEETNQFFASTPLLKVNYEDLTSTKTLRQVQKFIGLKPCKLNTIMKKQRTKRQKDYIANYEELLHECATRHPEYLRFFDRIITL